MKIKITKVPKASYAYGGQTQYAGIDLNQRELDPTQSRPFDFTSTGTLQPVPREFSDIEAEKGETIIGDFKGDGTLAHFDIGGKRHSEGGTPLKVPGNSYVYSDTAKMKIKEPAILALFNASKPSTPAQIAKKYDINKYQAMIDNPESDKLTRDTAQRMIDNHTNQLAKLAFVSEAKKGFPDGPPQIAQLSETQPAAKYGGYFQTGGEPYGMMAPQFNEEWQFNNSGIPEKAFVLNEPTVTDTRKVKVNALPMQMHSTEVPFTEMQALPTGLKEQFKPGSVEVTPSHYKNYGTSHGEDLASLASLYNMANIKKPGNYIAPIPKPAMVKFTPASYDRAIANVLSGANAAMQTQALTQQGQRGRANWSSMMGQIANAVGNLKAQENAENQQREQAASAQNANAMNQYLMQNAARATELFKQGEIGEQQYRNAKMAALAGIAKTNQAIESNIYHRNLTNAMHPNYEFDPRTNSIRFKGTGASLAGGSDSGEDFLSQRYKALKAAYPFLSDKEAFDAAHKDAGSYKKRTSTSAMNPKSNKSGTTESPYLEDTDYMFGGVYKTKIGF